jgi:hypothetical protein
MFSIVHLECDSRTGRCPAFLSPRLYSGSEGKGRKVVSLDSIAVLADAGPQPGRLHSVARRQPFVHTRTVAVTSDIFPSYVVTSRRS